VDQVEEVKSKTDIVELIQSYVPLKRAGRNYKANCPFHGEKTPSFMVNPDLQIYKCFGCGAAGDVFSFVERMEGMEFGEVLQSLAKKAGVVLKSWRPSKSEQDRERLMGINSLAAKTYHWVLMEHPSGKPALKYIQGRGITQESIEKFNLGYAPKGWDFLGKYLTGKKKYAAEDLERAGLAVEGRRYDRFRDRIMFPLTNSRGQVVGFAGRVMPGADEKAGGKYVNTPETEIYHKGDLLYGLDLTRSEIKQAGWAVIVEGELDAIASYQAGVKNVAAIKGSAVTQSQVEMLRRVADTLVLGLDADSAGDLASRRGIELAEKAGLMVKIINSKSETINPKQYKDPGEWAIADAEGWRKAVESAVPIYDFYLESAVRRYGLEIGGKKKIGQELLPLWAQINDEIVKGHYISRLASVVGVREEDIRAQLAKISKPELLSPKQALKPQEPNDQKSKSREAREGRVVALGIMGEKGAELQSEKVAGLIKSNLWQRVLREMGEKGDVKLLSAELREKVGEMLMTEEEFSEKNWQEAIRLLELTEVEERIKEPRDLKSLAALARKKAELTAEK